MEAPLSGSNDGDYMYSRVRNRISNLGQASAGAGKLFLISEDRLKILATLAKQVCQMCEEFYRVESKPSETTAHIQWHPTQEMLDNVRTVDVEASAAVTHSVSEEELSTIQSGPSIPALEERMESPPKTSVKNHSREGDFLLDSGGSHDRNDVPHTQPAMMESASAIKVENDISSEDSGWQIIQGSPECDTNRGDIAVYDTTHTQSGVMESSSAIEDDSDISTDRSEWQMPYVKIECGSDIGYYEGSAPTSRSAAVMINNAGELRENQGSGEAITQQNEAVERMAFARTGSFWKPGRTFTAQSGLIQHTRTYGKEKPYECQLCRRAFSVNASLVQHMRTHTGEKPFKCELCGRAFTARPGLIQHMRRHRGEKPYQCHYCEMAFTDTSTRRKHLRIHTGEKPFKCQECGRAFSRKSTLRTHMITHTGEKPFKCQQCDSAFARQYSLMIHVRTHTGEN